MSQITTHILDTALLLAAPAFRFHEARPALERILQSYEPLDKEGPAAQ